MNLNIKSAIKLKQTMIYALKYIFNRKCKRYLKIFQEYIARQQAISF